MKQHQSLEFALTQLPLQKPEHYAPGGAGSVPAAAVHTPGVPRPLWRALPRAQSELEWGATQVIRGEGQKGTLVNLKSSASNFKLNYHPSFRK